MSRFALARYSRCLSRVKPFTPSLFSSSAALIRDGDHQTGPPPIRVGLTESAGRAVFATRGIGAGDLIHTAKPVLACPSAIFRDRGVSYCSQACQENAKGFYDVETRPDCSSFVDFRAISPLMSNCGSHTVKIAVSESLKGRCSGGCKPDGVQLGFGRYGIKSCASGRLSYRAIESARRAMIGHFNCATSGQFRRNGKIWVRVFADLPVTSKPTEVRMGKGKGNVTGWVARVSTGQLLFEMDGVSLGNARQAAVLASHKLCLSTKFVQWS